MPIPHAWIKPGGYVHVVRLGHWDLVPAGKNFADMYEMGWIRIGGFGGYTTGEYTGKQRENFVQGRISDIAAHKETIGYMLEPGEHVRITFHEGGVAWVSAEEFWDSDIDQLASKAGLLASRIIPARRPGCGCTVKTHRRRA